MEKTNMSDFEKLEQHWRILLLKHQMIRYSEVKAGMVITLFSILVTLMFKGENILEDEVANHLILQICVSIFGVLVGISFFFAVRAFFPRFYDKNPRSVIYFGDVTTEFKNYKGYQKELLAATGDIQAMSTQISEQIHTLSTIAKAKFNNVTLSVKFFVAALALMFVTLVISLFTTDLHF